MTEIRLCFSGKGRYEPLKSAICSPVGNLDCSIFPRLEGKCRFISRLISQVSVVDEKGEDIIGEEDAVWVVQEGCGVYGHRTACQQSVHRLFEPGEIPLDTVPKFQRYRGFAPIGEAVPAGESLYNGRRTIDGTETEKRIAVPRSEPCQRHAPLSREGCRFRLGVPSAVSEKELAIRVSM